MTGEVLQCAGGLMVEHPLILPYRREIIGTEASVMGLSIELLTSLLKKLKLENP
jgi:septum formation protein